MDVVSSGFVSCKQHKEHKADIHSILEASLSDGDNILAELLLSCVREEHQKHSRWLHALRYKPSVDNNAPQRHVWGCVLRSPSPFPFFSLSIKWVVINSLPRAVDMTSLTQIHHSF